jgi:deoxyribodipyrimidine photo-lyase
MRALHWFRNDLRLHDNTAFAAAAAAADELVPVFVFDPHFADKNCGAPRLRFLLDCVQRLAADLDARGCPLVVRRGDPVEEIPRLLDDSRAGLLTFNRDYSPYACSRDDAVRRAAERVGVRVQDHKDRVIFESGEVLSRQGRPFSIYTPYRRAWLERFARHPLSLSPRLRLRPPVPRLVRGKLPTPAELGVGDDDRTCIPTGGEQAAWRRLRAFIEGDLRDYVSGRDRPAEDGTSRLSPYLHLGVVSIRACLSEVLGVAELEPVCAAGAQRWRDEIVWRDFYQALLAAEPRVLVEPFRREYAALRWANDDSMFAAWCAGTTGYPFVDAGMRQLAETGWVHNRVRMVVASFLVKDLLIDWRRGERFFLQRLVDGDAASNNGGWQWAASTGTDAQPYFRIFNPVAQAERFDPEGRYVRRFVPELRRSPDRYVHRPWEAPKPPPDYPSRIVDHAERRLVALQVFKEARRRARC